MSEVFISYKREDRPLAEKLAVALQARGWNVWWDHELRGGDSFRTLISDSLKQAQVVIVIWSDASVHSDWVLDEADRAAQEKKLLPVKFNQDVLPPMGFGGFQVEDLSEWSGGAEEGAMEHLQKQMTAISENRWKETVARRLVDATSGSPVAPDASWFFRNATTQIGGMPIGRLLLGAFGVSFCFTLISAAATYLSDSSATLAVLQSIIWVFILVVVTRVMHQFGIVARGKTSRQFFDNDFSFWFLLSVILAVFLAGLILILQGAPNIWYFAIISAGATLGFLFIFGFLRVIISGSILLFGRLR